MSMENLQRLLLLLVILLYSVCASALGYSSSMNQDVNGDGVKEVFRYSLNKTGNDYQGRLTITEKEKVLWEHEFVMAHDDLFNDLLMNEGNISVDHGVKHFFDGTLSYGATYKQYKISDDEIDMEYLDFYSEREHVPALELKRQILSQKVNSTFSYRASWREELVMLVYMPKLGKFIAYSGGEY